MQTHALPFLSRTEHSVQGSYDPLASSFSSLCQQTPKHLLLIIFSPCDAWESWVSPQRDQMGTDVSTGGTQVLLCWGGGDTPLPFSSSRRLRGPSSLIWLCLSLQACDSRERLSGHRGMASPQPGMLEMFPSHRRDEWRWLLKQKEIHRLGFSALGQFFLDCAHSPFGTCRIASHVHKQQQEMHFKILQVSKAACRSQLCPFSRKRGVKAANRFLMVTGGARTPHL